MTVRNPALPSIDRLITVFDRSLRVLAAPPAGRRPSPAKGLNLVTLEDSDRRHAAGLMRVNHAGEVCAQALYQGQALFARGTGSRQALDHAGEEELDHMAWCAERLTALQDRPSLLNPLWYAGSLLMGATAALAGDRWSLGFLVETERQVASHLDSHLERLPEADTASRAIVAVMRDEEAGHAEMAKGLGASELPAPLRGLMRITARMMTASAYWL